nr:HAMP domain-containing sensor histidine kinase [Kibdelosporangium sp. MJ126-NF4]CTQ97588.1 putative two-component system sensor kinase [Kibdelosporangium sp. MJ126-NF4]
MRTRLLLVLFLLSAAAVAGFAWPLLESTASSRTQELLISRTAELDRFAALAQQADDTRDTQQLAMEVRSYADLYGEAVLVVDARKRQVVATGGLRAEDVVPLIDGALRNQSGPEPPELRPWSSGTLSLARPVGAGTRVAGAVVLRASVTAAASDVAHDWLLIVVGALVAALVFALLALVVSRWVLKPLAQLERGVLALTAGEQRAHVPVSAGPRELRALGTSFNTMSDAVAEASEQQRRLVADASHQLRNPMAALRLRVDSLAGQVNPDGMRTYNGCVAEVERMESLLDGLLALATADNAEYRQTEEDTCDAATVLVERHDAWHAAADKAGTTLTLSTVDHFIVAMPESELGQVLDVLLDNAVKYAGSGARVELTCTAGTITVSDDGPGLPPEDLARATQRFWRSSQVSAGGTGLGLAIAERLVASRDGEMVVEGAEPHGLTVRITLPLESP